MTDNQLDDEERGGPKGGYSFAQACEWMSEEVHHTLGILNWHDSKACHMVDGGVEQLLELFQSKNDAGEWEWIEDGESDSQSAVFIKLLPVSQWSFDDLTDWHLAPVGDGTYRKRARLVAEPEDESLAAAASKRFVYSAEVVTDKSPPSFLTGVPVRTERTHQMCREDAARGWLELHSKSHLPPLLSNIVSTRLNISGRAAAAAQRAGLEIPAPTQELYNLLRSYRIAIDLCYVTDGEHPRPLYLDNRT